MSHYSFFYAVVVEKSCATNLIKRAREVQTLTPFLTFSKLTNHSVRWVWMPDCQFWKVTEIVRDIPLLPFSPTLEMCGGVRGFLSYLTIWLAALMKHAGSLSTLIRRKVLFHLISAVRLHTSIFNKFYFANFAIFFPTSSTRISEGSSGSFTVWRFYSTYVDLLLVWGLRSKCLTSSLLKTQPSCNVNRMMPVIYLSYFLAWQETLNAILHIYHWTLEEDCRGGFAHTSRDSGNQRGTSIFFKNSFLWW